MKAHFLKLKLFYINVENQSNEIEVNNFIEQKIVHNISSYHTLCNGVNYIVFVVQYIENINASIKKQENISNPMFEYLKAWRLHESRLRGIPAYAIMNDSLLAQIITIKPTKIEDFSVIKGFSEEKIKIYAAIILNKMKEFENNETSK